MHTPFTVTAAFDTSTPNLVSFLPFPGFVAYTPSSIDLEVGGQSYAVQPYNLTTHLGSASPYSTARRRSGLRVITRRS